MDNICTLKCYGDLFLEQKLSEFPISNFWASFRDFVAFEKW